MSLKTRSSLSVAIPHYNQSASLAISLKKLAAHRSLLKQILVVDNHSTGNHATGLEKLKEEFPYVDFVINEMDFGYDKNVDRCVKKSKGDFVWLLGAGDFPTKNSIQKASELIDAFPDLANIVTSIVPYESISDLNENLPRYLFNFNLPQISVDQHSTVPLSSLYNSALSGNIIKRKVWESSLSSEIKFDNWCHVERILQGICEGKVRTCVIIQPSIGAHVLRSSQGWWNAHEYSFLENLLLHAGVLNFYYDFSRLREFQLPSFATRDNLQVAKAILYASTIKAPANQQNVNTINTLLSDHPLSTGLFKITQKTPKSITRCARAICKIVYRSGLKFRKKDEEERPRVIQF